MKVRAKIILNQKAMQQLDSIQQQALELTTEAILTDIKTSGVVPKQTGELERSGFTKITRGKGHVIFDTPYARRLYWNPKYNFSTDKNPSAQGKWMETYHAGDKRVWVNQTYAAFLKQLSKGLIK